jgi:protein-S-isoprenylcysteine O-methyltransferase Ste14
MLFLRIYLLAGLFVHKAVWEILKRRPGSVSVGKSEQSKSGEKPPLPLQLVKAVKVVILLGIAVQTLLPDILPISQVPFVLRVAGTLIYTAGLLIAIRGRAELGTNWSDIETARILRDQTVVSSGLYRLIRHPIYVGDLLLLLGLELALNSWLVLGVLLLAPVVLMQAIREEKKLARALPGYEEYCASTKRFIPFIV